MIIRVRVSPNSNSSSVTRKEGESYGVKVDAPPRDGKANTRLVEILADHFHVPKSRVRIVRGLAGRDKVVEITI